MRTGIVTQCGRALMSALAPLTGNQATGQIRLRAQADMSFVLNQYAYVIPIIDGHQQPSWLFKVAEGPNDDGSWTIADEDVLVSVYSHVGGERYNLPEGTRVAFDYLIPELDLTDPPTVVADLIGGTFAADTFAGIQDIAMYEALEGPAISMDLGKSQLTRFPAVLVAFQDLTPADGVTSAQTSQGNVNAGDGTKFYKINYSISIILTRTDGEAARRLQGLLLVDDIMSELVDRHAALDGDPISAPGGVQIRQVFRENGPQSVYKKFHIVTILVSCMRAITRKERRTFAPWLRSSVIVKQPQSPALENQGDMTMVDMLLDMNEEQIDVTLDGTFTRASGASYWNGLTYREWIAGDRRIVDGKLLLEPAVENPLGTASTTFSLWTLASAASNLGMTESNPPGYSATATKLSLAANANSGLTLAGQAVAFGEPVAFTVFARAYGSSPQYVRLAAYDGVSEHVSKPLELTLEWKRVRFEFIPSSTTVELRIKNSSDALARTVVLWGASFDKLARWGAEYALDKPADVLTIDPPLAVLQGRWKVILDTLSYVPSDMTGAGLAAAPVVASVGNGMTDLMLLTLVGTPGSGGARLQLATRDGTRPLVVESIHWTPGDRLEFIIDASLGTLELVGTADRDGVYDFPAYHSRAVLGEDLLVLGGDASGTRGAVPGFFSVVVDV